MAYTDIDKPSDYFNTKLYTGTGSELAITGVGFQPDWVWTKSRSNTLNHNVYDSVRGVNKGLKPNTTDSEFNDAQSLKSFNSDGFTVGTDSHINTSSATFASWNWKESATSGFDIVQFESNGSGIATVSHNLNAVPKFIITKNIDVSDSWQCYHNSLGNTGFITLNTTSASGTTSTFWNSTTPTSSNFQVSKTNLVSGTIICYVFAEKKGFSKFGSYTGNGNADGTFVYTGFKPAFVIYKRYDSGTYSWVLVDNKRNTFNAVDKYVHPDLSAAEGTVTLMDFLSNGFKMRVNDTTSNQGSIIYMAFAKNPFTTSTGVPATAR